MRGTPRAHQCGDSVASSHRSPMKFKYKILAQPLLPSAGGGYERTRTRKSVEYRSIPQANARRACCCWSQWPPAAMGAFRYWCGALDGGAARLRSVQRGAGTAPQAGRQRSVARHGSRSLHRGRAAAHLSSRNRRARYCSRAPRARCSPIGVVDRGSSTLGGSILCVLRSCEHCPEETGGWQPSDLRRCTDKARKSRGKK